MLEGIKSLNQVSSYLLKPIMSRKTSLLTLFLFFICMGSLVAQTTYYSRASGNWNAATTWSTVGYGDPTNAGTFPVGGDIVLIGGTGYTVTITGAAAACASITIADNSALVVNNGLAVSGTTTVGGGVSGALSITSTAGTKTFSGLVTVNSGATWSEAVAEPIIFQGGITNNGTFTASTAVHTFNINSQTLSGALSIPSVTVTGAAVVLTNTNTLTVNTALSGTGRLTQGSNATLNLGGTSGLTNMTATASGNTVNYTSAVDQTVKNIAYVNLGLSGGGTKTLQTGTTSIGGNLSLSGTVAVTGVAGLTVGGSFAIGSGTSFTAGAFTHAVAGNWTNDGTFVNSGGTINFNGSLPQVIGGSVSTPFNGVILSGTGAKTFSVATTISGDMAISSGVQVDLNGLAHSANALTLNGDVQPAGTWGSITSGATYTSATYFTGTGQLTINTGTFTYYARATGDWNDASTWSTVDYSSTDNVGTFPVAGNHVRIGGGFTVTVTVAADCGTLTFATGSSITNTLTINSGNTLTVSGTVTIPQISTSGANIMNVGAGTLNAGNIAFTSGTAGGTGHRMTISTGMASVSGNVTGTGTSSSIVFTGAGILQLGGSIFSATTGTLTAVSGCTVQYNGGSQTVSNLAYNNLNLSGSGTKTLSATTTIGGNVNIANGVDFSIGATITVTGTTTVGGGTSGSLSIISTAGSKTFVGLVVIANGGTWSNTVDELVNFRGGITNNGTFNAGNGVQSFTINSQALAGTFSIPNVTVTGATVVLTNTNTLTVSTALTGTGRLTQGSNATLNLAGTSTITNMTASASGNTVNYNGGADQTVNNISFVNLGLAGSGTKTLQTGTTTITGNLAIDGTAAVTGVGSLALGSVTIGSEATFTAGTFAHNVSGNWTNDGTFVHSDGSINLNGSVQTIGGTATTLFNDLVCTGIGAKVLSVSTTMAGNLSIYTGAVVDLDPVNAYTANALVLDGAVQPISGFWGTVASGAPHTSDIFFSNTGVIMITTGSYTYYARATGDWDQNTTWSTVSHGSSTNAGSAPGAGDYVIIGGGFTVTVTTDAACGSINFDPGTSVTNTLAINGGVTLTVAEDITIPQTITSGSNTLDVGAGNLVTGNLSFTTGSTGTSRHKVTVSTGSVTVNDNVTGTGTSSSIIFSGAGYLGLGGSFYSPTAGTLTTFSGSTVEYTGGAQTVQPFVYSNLAISGTGTKTLATTANTTVGGDLTIQDNVDFSVGGSTLMVTGTSAIGGGTSGSLTITSTTGTKTFVGHVTINSGATWSNNANESVTFRGGITNSGTFTAGTAVQTFNTNSQTLTGNFVIPRVTVTGASVVLTNTNVLTVSNALSGTGQLTQGMNATLTLAAVSDITLLDASASGNTVEYSGAGNQTINNNIFYHLILSGGGIKTLQTGTTAIGGDFTLTGTVSVTGVTGLTISGAVNIGSGTTLTAGTFTHTLSGNWTNNGTFVHSGGTLNFNGAAQAISGTSATTFNNLDMTSPGGAITLLSNQNLYGTLTLGATSTFDAGTNLLTLLSTSDTHSASIGEIQTGATFNGSITVQRFMGAEGSFNRYVSAPVTGATISDLASGWGLVSDRAQYYDEPTTGSGGYKNAGLTATMVSGLGYVAMPKAIYADADITWDLTGPLTPGFNQKDVNLNPSYTNNARPNDDGWNILGNPYPSAIVWDGPGNWTISNMESFVYVPDVANPDYFMSWDYGTDAGVPGYGTLVDGVIASGQAFWVRAQASPTLIVHESAKTSSSGEFYRKTSSVNAGLAVTLSDNIGKDVSWLWVRPEASNGYDKLYDRSKLEAPAIAISFLVDERKLVNSTVQSIDQNNLSLSMKLSTDGEFSLSFEQLGGMADFLDLYLVDQELQVAHKITAGSYSFFGSKTGMPNRFYLTKNPDIGLSQEALVKVFPNPVVDRLKVQVSNGVESIELLNGMGQALVQHAVAVAQESLELDMSAMPSGVYLVRTTSEGKTTLTRIVKK
jgi:hypothetical protein